MFGFRLRAMCFGLLWVWGLHSGLIVSGGGGNILLGVHGVAGDGLKKVMEMAWERKKGGRRRSGLCGKSGR